MASVWYYMVMIYCMLLVALIVYFMTIGIRLYYTNRFIKAITRVMHKVSGNNLGLFVDSNQAEEFRCRVCGFHTCIDHPNIESDMLYQLDNGKMFGLSYIGIYRRCLLCMTWHRLYLRKDWCGLPVVEFRAMDEQEHTQK